MSDPRKPTTRLGRVKRDPRVDSTPPSARKSETRRPPTESKRPPSPSHGADGATDIDELLGRLLARATQAEVHAQQLEQTLQRLNEERLVLESRMMDLVHQLEDADAHRAQLEAQLRTGGGKNRSEGPVTLAYVRSMAAELVRAIDRVAPAMTPSNLPVVRPPSDLPTPRPRTERPRR